MLAFFLLVPDFWVNLVRDLMILFKSLTRVGDLVDQLIAVMQQNGAPLPDVTIIPDDPWPGD